MCPEGERGVCSASVHAANLEFYSDHGISFVKQGRTANRNYSQPYVRCSPSRRSCDTHTNVGHQQNSIFANYSATFSHLPLFRMGHIVSQNIMNYFAPRPSIRAISLSPSPPAFLVPAGVYIDLHGAARPINISTRTFACKSRTAARRERRCKRKRVCAHEREYGGVLRKIHATGVHSHTIRNSSFSPGRELLRKTRIYRDVFLYLDLVCSKRYVSLPVEISKQRISECK